MGGKRKKTKQTPKELTINSEKRRGGVPEEAGQGNAARVSSQKLLRTHPQQPRQKTSAWKGPGEGAFQEAKKSGGGEDLQSNSEGKID